MLRADLYTHYSPQQTRKFSMTSFHVARFDKHVQHECFKR